MRVTPLPEYQAEAHLPVASFDLIDTALRAMAETRGYELHDGHGRSVWCALPEGEFGAKKRGDGVLLYARAHDAQGLVPMQAAMDGIASDIALGPVRWIGVGDEGKPPQNFSLARVERVTQIAPDFMRLRLRGDRLDRLAADDSLHFRLIQPTAGDSAPEWPRIGPKGQTVWPMGEKALHRPVFTTRHIDAAAGWIETDIFLHDSGRSAKLARQIQPGTTLGLVGPSGGGIPIADRLVIGGDETAYPAIARILEKTRANGEVWLFGKRVDYPFPASDLIINYLPNGEAELARLLIGAPPRPGTFFWIGTERSKLEPLRQTILGALNRPAKLTHLSAYWSQT